MSVLQFSPKSCQSVLLLTGLVVQKSGTVNATLGRPLGNRPQVVAACIWSCVAVSNVAYVLFNRICIVIVTTYIGSAAHSQQKELLVQEFSSDMNSRPVKRIEDVVRLRTAQFSEDSGPIAHPIRPESYIKMDNFYTVTVYEKGAEIIRVYHTLLGKAGFRCLPVPHSP